MENQDKLYKQFKDAADKAEDKGFARMDAVWNRVEEKLDNQKHLTNSTLWKYAAIAATFLLFIGIGVFILNNEKNNAVTIPTATPENNVTVIDTQKVRQTFNPDKESEIEAFVTTEKTKKQIPVYQKPMQETEAIAESENTNTINDFSAKGYADKTVAEIDSQDKKKEESITRGAITADANSVAEEKNILEENVTVQSYMPAVSKKDNSVTRINTAKAIPFESSSATASDNSLAETTKTVTAEEQLKYDIKNQQVKLYILGGIVAHTYPGDDAFEQKYNISYYDFGCLAPTNMDFYSDYNILVLKYLTTKYARDWEKDVRKDIMGWNKWEHKE